MLRERIYLIHSGSTIESLYTLFPLIISRYNHLMVYLHVDSREAKMASGTCVILVRVFKGNLSFSTNDQKKRDLIADFRKRFDRVIMLDDGAGSDSLHFEYMDLVDLYYKGKLLRDRNNYLQPMYGRQLFTDYYHHQFNIVDAKEKIRETPATSEMLNKLRISWNLGYGIYPIPAKNLIRLAKAATRLGFSKLLRPWFMHNYRSTIDKLSRPVNLASKLNRVQARFGKSALPETIGFQRKLFLQKCNNMDTVLAGTLKPKLYNQEIRKVGAVLSPFGWGEVCFRDFETIINGGLLIKPDMGHLETWPDIYVEAKTYLAVDWDGNDLANTINAVTGDLDKYSGIVENAKAAYKNALLKLDDRVFTFLTEAVGEKTFKVGYGELYREQPLS